MSGKRARAERRRATSLDPLALNATETISTAERMLALDLTDVPLERQTQVIVGWMRAAFEQSLAIATLALTGLSHAGAPNRRCLTEIAVRLQWLHAIPHEDRARVVDTLIEEDRSHTRKAFGHLSDMGHEISPDLSEMESMVLDVLEKSPLKHQAKNFLEAAKATPERNGKLYYAWREETQYAHATSVLAVAHAPERNGAIGKGKAPTADPELELQKPLLLLIVVVVYQMLVDEGAEPEPLKTLLHTFFDLDQSNATSSPAP